MVSPISQSSSFAPFRSAPGLHPIGRAAALTALAFLGLHAASSQQNVVFLPNINVVAGAGTIGYTGDGGPATAATFASATQAAISDPFGNLYIVDTGNGVVRRVDAVTGIITTVVGSTAKTLCTGVGIDKYGNGCPATQAILNAPLGIRYFKGDLYIVDSGDNEVRKVSGTTGIITAFFGSGTSGIATAGVAATASPLNSPVDIVFDAAGNSYVPSAGGKPILSRIDAVTGMVSIVAGNGTAGTTGDSGPASAALINAPTGAALDPQGNLYISQGSPENIRKITAPGSGAGIITTAVGPSGTGVAGFGGDGGPANLAQLNTPQHIAFDGAGNLYIADFKNHRIRMVTPPAAGATYGIITTIVGATSGSSGNGGPAVNALLTSPRDVEFTPAGDLLIMDGGTEQVRLVAPPSIFPATAVGANASQNATLSFLNSTTVGSIGVPAGYPDFNAGTSASCTAGSPISSGSTCTYPLTFQPAAAGNRYAPFVAQTGAGVRDILGLTGLGNAPVAAVLPGVINAAAGTGVKGNAGDNAAATAALLNNPGGVTVDGQNNIFFADTANNEIREIAAATGSILRVAGTGAPGFSGDSAAATAATLNAPSAVAVDGAGNLYIADTGNNRIRLVSAATGLISTFAGTGTAGFAGDFGAANAAQLSAPQGLYLAPGGALYIADTGNNVIRTIGTRSALISTIAGTGAPGYTGDTGEGQLATLTSPTAVALDATGNLYIADTGNNVIRKITNGIISTYAGTGTAGYTSGPLTTSAFSAPSALAVDAASNVYVADTGNNVIRRLSGGQVGTVAGTGNAGATGNLGSSTTAMLNAPRGLALDLNGNILLADSGNNTLRAINVAAGSLIFPNTSPNTTSAPQAVAVNNDGNLPLAIASVTVPAGFAEQPSGALDCNGTGVSLAPATACQVSVVFQPTAVKTYSGNITVTDNSQSQAAATQSIAVSGIGIYVFTATISAPPSAVAGAAQTVTVSITNPNAVYTGTVHFTSSDPRAVLPANYTFTAADNGKHIFTGVVFNTAGMETISVTDTTLSSITATALVTVVGGPPASLAIVSGNNQSTLIFTSFKVPLVVKALDASGNPSAGASVNFTAPVTGADASFNGSATYTAVTNSLGLVTTPTPLTDGVTGTYTVTATATGASAAVFTLTNTSNVAAGFNLSSNPANIYSLAPGSTQTTTILITPLGGFNAPVNVACTGAIAGTTCSLSMATVAASGNGSPTSVVLTVTTTGPASAQLRPFGRGGKPVFACLLLFAAAFGLLKRNRLRGVLFVLLTGAALVSFSGCGSNTFNTNTQPGQYTLTITGTSGTITNTVQVTCFVAGQSS